MDIIIGYNEQNNRIKCNYNPLQYYTEYIKYCIRNDITLIGIQIEVISYFPYLYIPNYHYHCIKHLHIIRLVMESILVMKFYLDPCKSLIPCSVT